MDQFFLIVQMIIVFALVILILFQQHGSDGFGGMGGGMNAVMSGRAKATFFTKTTAILAFLFIVNSLFLAKLSSNKHEKESIMQQLETIIDFDQESSEKPNQKETLVPLSQ